MEKKISCLAGPVPRSCCFHFDSSGSACLSELPYLLYPDRKKQHFNIDISELKIPELDIKLPDEIRIENMTDSITPDNSAENAVDSAASSSKSPDFITTTTPPAEWLQLGTTASLPSFSDGFISLGDAALAGGIYFGQCIRIS